MTRIAAAVLLACLLGTTSHAQMQMHGDGHGYTLRSGNQTFINRNPGYGTSSTHMRAGNAEFHNWNNGTRGSSIYTPSGRYDNYSNPNQGWSGNGYTPSHQNNYYGGQGTTYRRHNYGY